MRPVDNEDFTVGCYKYECNITTILKITRRMDCCDLSGRWAVKHHSN